MNGRETFAVRLKEVRLQTGKNQKDFAAMVQSTAATISAYENATKNPSLEIVANIAEKCNISIDWLCGLTNKMNSDDDLKTYADLIRLFLKIQKLEFAPFGFDFKAYSDPNSFKNMETGIFTTDKEMYTIIQDIQKMQSVLNDGTIDQNIYDTWLEGFLEKHNTPLPTWASITGHDTNKLLQGNPLISIINPDEPPIE